MISQILEQIVEFEPTFGRTKLYEIIDIYKSRTSVLYTPKPKPFEPKIVPTNNGIVIPHPSITDIPIKDWHDTYKIDRYDNPYGGHTTLDISGFPKKRINHED